MAVLFVGAACGSSDDPAAVVGHHGDGVTTTLWPRVNVVATAIGPSVDVFDSPLSTTPLRTMSNPQPSGTRLVFLVREQPRLDWVNVYLPVRPNGSTGWVRPAEVELNTHDFRIAVDLSAHHLTVWDSDRVLAREPVAVGRSNTPTPGGLYYTSDVLVPVDAGGQSDPDGPYGPYAYALSGFSEVLYNFAGGQGQIGIHGTNDPEGVGKDASHGCIHMTNESISRLIQVLPLGVPVEIRQ